MKTPIPYTKFRNRNRFLRVVFSRHMHDFKIIALLASYIDERLEARLRPPILGTHEEFESYLHPAYVAAVRKTCERYEKFYGDVVEKEIIGKLGTATAINTKMSPSRLALQTLRSLGIVIGAVSVLMFCGSFPALAQQADACTANSAHDILAAAEDSKDVPRIQGVPSFDIAPIAGPMSLALRRTFGADKIDNYRVVVQFGHDAAPPDARAASSEGVQISASEIPETNALRLSNLVAQHDTLLTLITPAPPVASQFGGWVWLYGWGWHGGRITVVGCTAKKVVFIAPLRGITFSDRTTCILVTVLAALLVYLLVSKGVHTWDNRLRPKKIRFGRYLDPVMLSSGPNGKGSISRLQILFFSTLLFALLLYILIRVGLLSDMSTTVLLLLGISGIGAAASKATDVGLNRLDFNNWA